MRLLLIVVAALAACRPSGPPADAGAVKDGVYRNEYFGLSLPVPQGWRAEKPPLRLGAFLEGYLKLVAAGDIHLKDVEGVDARIRRMFRLSSARMDLAGYEDALVSAAAVELGYQPKIRKGSHCLAMAEVVLRASKTDHRVLGRRSILLGGLRFDVMDIEVKLSDGKLRQSVYIIVRWGHALIFEVVSRSPRGFQKGEKALAEISFKKTESHR